VTASSYGQCGNNHSTGVSGGNSCDDPGVNHFVAYTGNVHREIKDLELFAGVGDTLLKWVRYGNSRLRNLQQPFGNAYNWRHEYEFEMADDGPGQLKIHYPAGDVILFTQDPQDPSQWLCSPAIGQTLVQHGTTFSLQMSNGFRYRFEKLTTHNGVFYELQSFLDSHDYLFRLSYQSGVPVGRRRLVNISEPAGRFLQITYGIRGGMEVITSVSTSDGRSVTYTYDDVTYPGFVCLTNANYGDTTYSIYEYSQDEPEALPLLAHAVDPRVVGNAVNMRYEYDSSEHVIGEIEHELNGVTGEIMVTRTATPTVVTVTYANANEHPDTFNLQPWQEGNANAITDGVARKTSYEYFGQARGFVRKKVDPVTGVTHYDPRSPFGQPLSMTHPDGSPESWTRDDLDLVTSHTDRRQFTTTFRRDGRHRVFRIEYPDTSYETFTYNNDGVAFGQLLDHRLRNGGNEHFEYYPNGLKKFFRDAETPPGSNTTEYRYDTAGRLSLVKDLRQKPPTTTQYEYYERGLLKKITYADTTFKQFGYDEFGNLTSTTDENGHTWTTLPDEFRRVKDSTDPLGRVTHYNYDLPGDTCGCRYEEAKPSEIDLPSGLVTKIEYDMVWRKTSETVGYGSPDAATTLYQYPAEDEGRTMITTDPRRKVWKVTYDPRLRMRTATDPFNNETVLNYDEEGNITKITLPPPDGGFTAYEFDSMNRLKGISKGKGEVLTENISIDYDPELHFEIVNDARGWPYETRFDLLHRKRFSIYPDNSQEEFTWDSVNNLLTYKTRAGQLCTYVYDNRNRETSSTWNDPNTPSVSRTYYDNSQLKTMTSSVSALTYQYNNANQLTSETQEIIEGGGGPKTVQYTYYDPPYDPRPRGLLRSVIYPDDTEVLNDYTGRDQVKLIAVNGGQPLVNYDPYDLNGNRTNKALENGTNTISGFDKANRIESINHQTVALFDYRYDSASRRKAVQRDADKGDVFHYDPIDQVTEVDYEVTDPFGVPSDPSRVVKYDTPDHRLDRAGNRTAVIDNDVVTVYTPANRLNQYNQVGNNDLTYDANGNLATQGDATYVCDAQNRLISAVKGANEVTFAYDPMNRCVKRIINGIATFRYFDGWNLIDERNDSDVQIARYVNGTQIDEILSRTTADGPKYYHYDSIGNVVALTDSTGTAVERYAYDIFGTPTIRDRNGTILGESAFGNRSMFTGRDFIHELSLYDFRNRFYSPELGRFLQPDPVGFNAGDYNLYRYVGNDPVNRIDPLGSDDSGHAVFDVAVGCVIGFFRHGGWGGCAEGAADAGAIAVIGALIFGEGTPAPGGSGAEGASGTTTGARETGGSAGESGAGGGSGTTTEAGSTSGGTNPPETHGPTIEPLIVVKEPVVITAEPETKVITVEEPVVITVEPQKCKK
jgi:RHS repeat-associated protein